MFYFYVNVCVGVLFVQCQRRPEEGAEVELQEVVSLLMMGAGK